MKVFILAAAALAVVAACSSTEPALPGHIELLGGEGQSALAGNPLAERVAVRVTDQMGLPLPNALVHFAASPASGELFPSLTRTDASGIARASWTLGAVTGQQLAVVTTGSLSPLTVSATAVELAESCSGSPLALERGESILLSAMQLSQLCIGSTPFFTTDYVAVAYNGNRLPGRPVDFAVSGTGTVSASMIPTPSPAASPEQAAALADPRREPSDSRLHRQLRELELAELSPLAASLSSLQRLSPSTIGSVPTTRIGVGGTPAVAAAVGDVLALNANSASACSLPVSRSARIVAVSDRAVVMEDIGNPDGGFSEQEYLHMARTFDTLIYPVVTDNFGEPTDIDRNGRVLLFFTVEVNRLTPPGAGQGSVAGFFFARDLFSRGGTSTTGGCTGSNQSEMFYLMAPDPLGSVNGNQRSRALVLERTLPTLAHEFQHLINASRRLHVNRGSPWPEQIWLDEALAHSAEELVFYRAARAESRQNIGASFIQGSTVRPAYDQFQSDNVARLRIFLDDTRAGWMFNAGSPDASTRGALESFMRYTADRRDLPERDFWRALAAGPDTGMRNLEQVLQADPMRWLHDWLVALYADDVVHDLPERHRTVSWNLRSVMTIPGSPETYPMRTVPVIAGEAAVAHVAPGGAAFFRFGVPPSGVGQISISTSGLGGSAAAVLILRTW